MSDHRGSQVEQTAVYADKTLAELNRLGLPATPQNYAVWYAHITGENPKLSRHLEEAFGSGSIAVNVIAEELFYDHCTDFNLSENVIEVSAKVEEQVCAVAQALADTEVTTSAYGDALEGASGQLNTDLDAGAMRSMLDKLSNATRAMEVHSRALEAKLSESTKEINELRKSMESIRTEALTDALTGVGNRKFFDDSIKLLAKECASGAGTFSLLIGDVDYFKKFNDKWGHQTGDQVLRLVASCMTSNVKGRDLVARYGGEEFAILLPNTPLENAAKIAEQIRTSVEGKRLRKRSTNEDLGVITLSIGVAQFAPNDTVGGLIERADQCLYIGKRSGRNRVIDERSPDFVGAQAKSVA